MIDGVKTKKLSFYSDERGRVMEVLRSDDELFEKFGQAYITTAYPGVVKAWHYHKKQTDNFCVLSGTAKVALYDNREGSSTKGKVNEFFIGEHNPMLLQIPKGVYHGFKGIGTKEVILLSIPTEQYNRKQPDEFRIDPYDNDIPYKWELKEG